MSATHEASPARSRTPRRRVPAKLDLLPPDQRAALEKFFLHDGLTYHATIQRMAEKFGVKLSTNTLTTLWKRHNQPAPPAQPNTPALLDIVITPSAPVRLRITQEPPAP